MKRSYHGHARHFPNRSREYESWQSMKKRCLNPNNPKFPSYGKRGIKICLRWKDSFPNFLADMGLRPKGKTIDRFPDNDGNYEPGNCRWATPKQQARNRRIKTFRMVGKEFGFLIVLKMVNGKKKHGTMWLCRCICGRKIRREGSYLRKGMNNSCGCKKGRIHEYKKQSHSN